MFRIKRSARVVATLAAAVVMATTASCSSGEKSDGAGGEVQLRFAWWGNPDRAAATNKVIDAFEAANPTIKVQGEPSDFNGYFDKLATNVAANDAPDVFTLGGAYPAEYANRGALLDLATVAEQLPLTDFDPAALQSGQVKGTQYGITTGTNALGMVVNPEVFEAAGVELPNDETWTWDEFAAIAKQVTEKSPAGTYGTATPLTHDSLDAFARQRGEKLYTEDGKLGITVGTVEQFFAFSLALSKAKAAPGASETVELQAASPEQTLMGQGKAGMMLTWTNSVGTLGKAAGAELMLLKLPGESPTPGIWLQASQFYSIAAKSKHPKEAAMLVDYLANNADAAKVLLTDRGVPSNTKMRTAIEPLLSPDAKVQVAYIDKLSKLPLQPTFIGPTGSTAVAEITNRVTSDVLFERQSPADAAAQWMQESEQAIVQ